MIAPDDFRSIRVLPSPAELLCAGPPFLPPHIIDGPYPSLEHYLDTQFRLLREDFVRPLSKGVQEAVAKVAKKPPLSVRIYKRVRFLRWLLELDENKKLVNEGLLVCLNSSDTNQLTQRIHWEHFQFGTLLCFSSNDFKTIFFATVSSGDEKFQQNCQILASLYGECADESIFDPKKSFAMIECGVNIESYNQMLKSLQEFNEKNFPMPRYLLEVHSGNKPPSYLLSEEAEKTIRLTGVGGQNFRVKLLDKSTWPSAQQLGLDESQLEALQAALGQELALVQGAPGTGKSFMAVKIAEILLKIKKSLEVSKAPILFICQSNGALDKFLAGVWNVTQKLVRIGGQCTVEQLEKFNLKNLFSREICKPGSEEHALRTSFGDKAKELSAAEKRIMNIKKSLVMRKGILPDPKCFHFELKDPAWILGELRSIIPAGWDFIDLQGLEKFIDLRWKSGDTQTSAKKGAPQAMNKKKRDSLQFKLQCVIGSFKGCKLPDEDAVLPLVHELHRASLHTKIKVYFRALQDELRELELNRMQLLLEIRKIKTNLRDLKLKRKLKFLKKQDILGVTAVRAASLAPIIKQLRPAIVIVEEAAEIIEPRIVTSLSSKCQHLILIGDNKQTCPSLSGLREYHNFDVSLFERLVRNRADCVTLRTQHRMCPEIAKLIVPSVYDRLENHTSVLGRPGITSLDKRLFFRTHSELEDQLEGKLNLITNDFEAEYVVTLCTYLLYRGYSPAQITILATYKEQKNLIRQKISESGNKWMEKVLVSVVDDFKGEESEIVLLSLVRSNPDGRIGFLESENRVCVALSRARSGLFIVGNMDTLAARSRLWKEIKAELENQNAIGETLHIRCKLRPEKTTPFALPSHLEGVIKRCGCDKMCY